MIYESILNIFNTIGTILYTHDYKHKDTGKGCDIVGTGYLLPYGAHPQAPNHLKPITIKMKTLHA